MTTVLLILLTLFLILVVLWLFAMRTSTSKHRYEEIMSKQIYAHRGLHDGGQNIPENTLEAFSAAIQKGYGIELDVHISADQTPVVIHDTNLLDTTGLEADINEVSDNEIKLQKTGAKRCKIPFLYEALNLVNGKVPLLIEIKTDKDNYEKVTDATMQVLENYKGVYAIQSFDPRVIKILRKKYPDVMRGQISGYLNEEGANLPFSQDFALRNLLTNMVTRPDFVSYRIEDFDKLPMRILRTVFNPTLFAWTIRDNSGFRKCRIVNAAPVFDEMKFR